MEAREGYGNLYYCQKALLKLIEKVRSFHSMRKVSCLVLFLLLGLSLQVTASPTGKDIITACEESLASDFQGVMGMMCTWYVTPCDCTTGKNPEIKRVCLPDDRKVEDLAEEVIDGLKLKPELQSRSAEVASSIILSEKYPCD